jgi:di/tripeptidase
MRHVPWPIAEAWVRSGNATVLISIQSHLESAKAEETFSSTNVDTVSDCIAECVAGNAL